MQELTLNLFNQLYHSFKAWEKQCLSYILYEMHTLFELYNKRDWEQAQTDTRFQSIKSMFYAMVWYQGTKLSKFAAEYIGVGHSRVYYYTSKYCLKFMDDPLDLMLIFSKLKYST